MEEVLNNDFDLAKELLTVIPYLNNTFVSNLPRNFIANLTTLAANSTKDFYIQKDKRLEEQNLSEECKNWLSLLYYEYVDLSDKKDILESWFKNDFIEK